MTIQTRNSIISVILAIIIIILGYFLYHSIVDPYKVVEKNKKMTTATRQNMDNLRVGIISYKQAFGHYPPSEGGLDSVVSYLRSDTLSVSLDSLMSNDTKAGYKWNLDSLIYSPRPPHKEFIYIRNDTTETPLYVLKDPDTTSNDHIGSLTQVTKLNIPSWK